MAVKLRKPIEVPAPNGADVSATQTVPLKPLAISAVCITKATLIEALRVYVPTLSDIEVVEDGERFLLVVAPSASAGAATDSGA